MPSDPTDLAGALRAYALSLPETHEDFPWGELVIKVRKKVFVFLGMTVEADGSFGFSVKLPRSSAEALALGGKPTGYGLGKAGWVSLKVDGKAPPPYETLRAFLEESYRAVAPKTVVKKLDNG